MEKTDVLVIGGSAAGLVAASTAKSKNPDKRVLVVRKDPIAMIPCGIPYIFEAVGTSEKNILPDMLATKPGAEILIAEVISIDKENKTCKLNNGDEISYEKLVIGTGSTPLVPSWLEGADLKNVFVIPKDKVYLDEMHKELGDCKKIITIGAGFIGVEMSDQLNKAGKDVTLVEIMPHILGAAFDEDVCIDAENVLKETGVKIVTGKGAKKILGNDKVTGVLLDDGTEIEADAVVLSMGYKPNVKLAQDAGLAINEKGFIKVDEYMRTDDPDIYAAGDCAEKRDFVTRKLSATMLASTACAEARIAAMNLYKLSALKTFNGTIAIYSTAIDNHGYGTAGVTEKMALAENFDVITGEFEGVDRHPGNLPDSHKQKVKLVVSKDSGTVIGGEVVGGLSAGELINVIGFIIQNKMTVSSILTAQIGTQPLLTASPAGYPLIKAAEMACAKK
jgi:NADH oxidase (H2O2-forming)